MSKNVIVMKQVLMVILASVLNERLIVIGITENVIVWWKICIYFGGKAADGRF